MMRTVRYNTNGIDGPWVLILRDQDERRVRNHIPVNVPGRRDDERLIELTGVDIWLSLVDPGRVGFVGRLGGGDSQPWTSPAVIQPNNRNGSECGE